MATFHPTLPRGARINVGRLGTIKEILVGPAHENDGRLNLMGALRTSMATCGYESVKEFRRQRSWWRRAADRGQDPPTRAARRHGPLRSGIAG